MKHMPLYGISILSIYIKNSKCVQTFWACGSLDSKYHFPTKNLYTYKAFTEVFISLNMDERSRDGRRK